MSCESNRDGTARTAIIMITRVANATEMIPESCEYNGNVTTSWEPI